MSGENFKNLKYRDFWRLSTLLLFIQQGFFSICTIVFTSLEYVKLEYEEQSSARSVCIAIMAMASVIFVIALCGCCGGIKENTGFLWLYAFLLLLLMIGNCVLIFGYGSALDGEMNAKISIDIAWEEQLQNNTERMDWYQKQFDCCGRENSSDYSFSNETIPESCYKDGNSQVPFILHQWGCYEKFGVFLKSAENWIRAFFWLTMLIEAMSVGCACYLAINLGNEQRRAGY